MMRPSTSLAQDRISPEETASWYLRLNGCFQIQNFVLHPDIDCSPSENQKRTDADSIAVRLPWRDGELGMPDDKQYFEQLEGRTLIWFVEVKRGICEINGPWTNPTLQNMPRVLKDIGCIPEKSACEVAKKIYSSCRYDDDRIAIRMAAIGDEVNSIYLTTKPGAIQITWTHILGFIRKRFADFETPKADHQTWPEIGIRLWDIFQNSGPNTFAQKVLARFAGR